MKLYYAPGTCAVSVWIALHWVGADFETERVKLDSVEYKRINPSGAVPALETEDGDIKNSSRCDTIICCTKVQRKRFRTGRRT